MKESGKKMIENRIPRIDPLCEIPIAAACTNNTRLCSPLFSASEIGDYCRQQFSRLSDSAKDTVMENYCIRNDSEECKCINRSSNEDYIKLKKSNPYMDSCWYIPCANRSRYLVTSDFNVDTKCPENICQIIVDTAQTHDVDIDHIKNDINCDFTSGGTIPVPSDAGTLPPIVFYGSICIAVAFIIVYALKK